MRRCVTSILHMRLLLIVIEPNRGNVALFLESDDKTRMLKRVRMPKAKQMAFCPPEIKRRSVIGRLRITRSSRVSLKECVQFMEQYDR
jgi:hypothetical protein